MTADSRVAPGSSVSRSERAIAVSRACFARAVLGVTLVAGTLDIVAAHLHVWAIRGQFPTTLLKVIAGGTFGRERALQGGWGMLAMGLLFHFIITGIFTTFLFLLYPRWSVLRQNVYAVASGYTLFVWSVMNFIIVPQSSLAAPLPNLSNQHTYIGIAVLYVAIGLPITFGARRFYRARAGLNSLRAADAADDARGAGTPGC